MLIAPKGPIVIRNNTFEENIGTIGGAIHIFSPDFEANLANEDMVNPHPYISI